MPAESTTDHVTAFLANLKPPLTDAEVKQRREAEATEAELGALRRRERELLRRGIPAKDIERLLAPEGLIDTRALEQVRDWLADPAARRLLVLSGRKDAGKTTAAAYAAASEPLPEDLRWLREHAPGRRYVEAELLMGPWMFYRLAERDGKGIEHTHDPVTGLNRGDLVACSLLVIDDLGQEAAALAGDVGEVIDVLVRLRCDRRLRTVITTNELTVEALSKRYGPRGARLAERITEHGLWVDCPVEGLRGEERRKAVLQRRAHEK